MRTNFAHKHNFYINPRNRVFPALTSAGVSYIKNDVSTNMRGTYRMQCGATTDLTYLYTLPQRFIIEGWFKPEFAYDVASDTRIFTTYGVAAATSETILYYRAVSDTFNFYTISGGVGEEVQSVAILSTAALQKWVYIRCYFDNTAKLKGFYSTINGVAIHDAQVVPGAGTFTPANKIAFSPAIAAEFSYWIIHELDETLATGEYKTYKADRQIIFDFNGTTLGRERIRIPVVHEVADDRGVLAFDLRKGVDAPMTGNPGANTAGLTFKNINGQFSDDQYDAFDPFNGRYNGTQKYLQNRVGVEIDSESPANTVRDGLFGHWSFDDLVTPGRDNSGNGNSATVTGAIPVDGMSGKARLVDGVDDKITITKAAALYAKRTMAFWYKHNADSASGFLSDDSLGGAFSIVPLYAITVTTFTTYVGQNSTSLNFATTFNIRDNAWHHLVFVFDRSNATKRIIVYIDGIERNSNALVDYDLDDFGHPFKIGLFATANYNAGSIDEFRIYDRALTAAEALYLYANPADWGALSKAEPLFLGRTTPGAFHRTSPNKYYGEARIEAEDCVAELGEARLSAASAFDTFKLSDPTTEAASLFHAIARLVTKKEIRNYALNSSGENATPANSWLVSGAGITLSRSNTYAQFGTYSLKCIATGAGDYIRQVIKFESTDKIDVGDVFNFSAFIVQGTASTVKIQIEELTVAGALVGTASETVCGTDTAIFTRVNVSRTILSSTCTELRITFYAVGASTFYADGIMLTRGIDALDYFLLNATDGAAGIGSADSAATTTYDTVAIDADSVNVVHPWVEVERGDQPWSHLKAIGEASLASYLGATPDGVLTMRVRYNETDEDINGDVEDIGGIGTALSTEGINSIAVYGSQVVKETGEELLYSGQADDRWTHDGGKLLYHAIASGVFAALSGATEHELKYDDSFDAGKFS
ncbi:MAG: LamG domain-containing protein [Vicinamibacterales bacterium]